MQEGDLIGLPLSELLSTHIDENFFNFNKEKGLYPYVLAEDKPDVSIPKDCVVSQIDINNIKIKNINKNKKRVYLDSKMSVIVKYSNDKWMVEKTLIYCK